MFINEQGNDEAVNAMNNVYNYVSNSSSIGVTLYTEYVEGTTSNTEAFVEKCKYSNSNDFITDIFVPPKNSFLMQRFQFN